MQYSPYLTVQKIWHTELILNSGKEGGQPLLWILLGEGRLDGRHIGPVGQNEAAQSLAVPHVGQSLDMMGWRQSGVGPGKQQLLNVKGLEVGWKAGHSW